MMTINAAEHFGLTKEMGMIAPGRWADILLVDDLMDHVHLENNVLFPRALGQ